MKLRQIEDEFFELAMSSKPIQQSSLPNQVSILIEKNF